MRVHSYLWIAILATILYFPPLSLGIVAAAEGQEDQSNPFEIPLGPSPSGPLPTWAITRLEARSKDLPAGVRHLALSDDARLVAAGDAQGVKVWDVSDSKPQFVIDLRQSLSLLSFARGGKVLMTAGTNPHEKIITWDVENRRPLARFGQGGEIVQHLPDNGTLLVGSDGHVTRLSIASGKELDRIELRLRPIAISRDGRRIAAVAASANERGLPRIEVYDFPAHGVAKLDGLEGPPTCSLFSPDGTRFVAADRESPKVHTWLIARTSHAPSLSGHAAPVVAMAFSLDGRHLATASEDKTVLIWEVSTAKPIVTLRGHCEPVVSVAFSADGRRLATGAAGPTDATVVIWDVAGALYTPSYKTHPRMKPEELDNLWDALAVDEPKSAYGAIGAFTSIPQEAVSYLEDQLRETFLPVSQEEIDALVRQLGDDDYFVRERAQQQLPKLRMPADRALRKALADSPVNELHYRVRKVLQIPLPKSELSETQLRQIRRTILALELIATPQAVKLLEKISNAYPNIDIMDEGFAAWNRLKSKTR